MNKLSFLIFIFTIIWLSCSADNWNYVEKVVASDRCANDFFGKSVSISSDYVVIGACYNGYNASGDNFLNNAGAAYIYHKEGSTWIQTQKIVASDRLAMAGFGWSVSISGDYAVISNAPAVSSSGITSEDQVSAIYIFKRNGASWIQQQKIMAPGGMVNNGRFGDVIFLSGDYVIVGAPCESEGKNENVGTAYIYKRCGESWTLQNKIVAPYRAASDWFGSAVSISGGYAVVASRGRGSSVNNDWAGAVDFFKLDDGVNWIFQQREYYTSSEAYFFGSAVSISGDYAAISADMDNTDSCGNNVSSIAGRGSVFIFKRIESSWVLQQKIVPFNRVSSEYFGESISINDKYLVSSSDVYKDGNPVYIYRRDSSTWNFVQKLKETNSRNSNAFGCCVAISDDDILIGSYDDDFDENEKDSMPSSGAAYYFTNNNYSLVEAVVVNKNISVYTTADQRIVILNHFCEKSMDISLYQINGHKIKASNLCQKENTFEYKLKPGIYILNVKYDKGQMSKKIMIR